MEEYKKIKEELVYRGAIIDVYKDYVRLPNGKEVVWDLVKHKGAAAIVPIDKDGKILLVRQYRNALERFTLEIPAGGINPGETPLESATRELEEETGYKSSNIGHLVDSITAIGFCNEAVYTYYATDLIPSSQNLDEDEFVDVVRFSMEELIGMILSGEIKDAKTVAGVLTYKAMMER